MAYILSDSFKLLGIKTMGLFLSYPILGKIKKYPRCNPPVAHSTCCRSVTPSFSMAKELVNLQKNNTKSFISIFLII